MNTLLKAYAEMIGHDLDAEVPHIKMHHCMMNLSNLLGSSTSTPKEMEREDAGVVN